VELQKRAEEPVGESRRSVPRLRAGLGITETTFLQGPSIWSREPAIRLQLQFASDPSDELVESLLLLLPGLTGQDGECDLPALLARHRPLSSPLPLSHLFEHVAIELQNLGGAELSCCRRNDSHNDDAVIPFEDEDVGLRSAALTLALLRSLLRLPPPEGERVFNFPREREAFVKFAKPRSLPVQDRALIATARDRGIAVTRIARRVVQLGAGRYQQRFSGTKTSLTNVVSNDLAANKDYSRRVLGGIGLPSPLYERVFSARRAVEAARRIGFPVVVKPNNGNMGSSVSIKLKTGREVREAFRLVRRTGRAGRSAIVEEFVPGNDYRLLVIDGKLVAAAHRVPAHVVGDGVRTIEQLIEAANSDPRRGSGTQQAWTKLVLDDRALLLLKQRGHSRTSVPGRDQAVYLRRNANTSDGGTAVDITDDVHPDNREIAIRAARAIGLDVAGVDLLTTDVTRSMWETGGCICEINSRPGIRKHIWPAKGRPRDVTGAFIDMLFPAGSPVRIPIAAVVDPDGDSRTARLLAHFLTCAGHRVGLATTQALSIGNTSAGRSSGDSVAAARRILFEPSDEIAVLALTPRDVLEQGLPFEQCDVGAIVGSASAGSSEPDELTELLSSVTRAPVVLGKAGKRRPRSVTADQTRLATSLARGLGVSLAATRRALESFADADPRP
jgi:cyanophycin synthetase